jgi:hypothetical protein
MGLLEILIVFALTVAIIGGIAVHPLLFLLLLLAAGLFLTRGGLGSRRV